MAIDPTSIQFGLDTFGDVESDLASGEELSHAQVIRNTIEEAVLADSVGIDVFGIGEHHRDDYAISSPDMVLATIAGKTENIKLIPAVTVLSSNDPVRVFQRFSTLQAASNGRAELMLGRGSFTESFPLFGYELKNYESLFEDKLELMRHILDADAANEPVSWDGRSRPAIDNIDVYPRLDQALPSWVAVGGSPASTVRAAKMRMWLMLAIIGGSPTRFAPFVELFQETNKQLGNPQLPIGVHSPGLIAPTDKEAQQRLYPHWRTANIKVGRDRGWMPPGIAQFHSEIGHGSLYVGSPETVAQKIATTVKTLGLNRFQLKYSNGPVPHEWQMESIQLYGEEVIPRVRELLS